MEQQQRDSWGGGDPDCDGCPDCESTSDFHLMESEAQRISYDAICEAGPDSSEYDYTHYPDGFRIMFAFEFEKTPPKLTRMEVMPNGHVFFYFDGNDKPRLAASILISPNVDLQ